MEIIKTEAGSLTILTGKTNMGKSTITVYDAAEALRVGKRVMFFSYEYPQSIIYNKLITHFHVNWPSLLHLNIVEASGFSLQMLVQDLRAKKDSLDLVYIDYLDLLREATFGEHRSEETELKQIQDIVKTLAALAKELNISIILLSQVGSSSDFEKSISRLNAFSETTKDSVIKMFLGKGNIIDPRIVVDEIVHLILVDGYDLRHFSSINLREIYKEGLESERK